MDIGDPRLASGGLKFRIPDSVVNHTQFGGHASAVVLTRCSQQVLIERNRASSIRTGCGWFQFGLSCPVHEAGIHDHPRSGDDISSGGDDCIGTDCDNSSVANDDRALLDDLTRSSDDSSTLNRDR